MGDRGANRGGRNRAPVIAHRLHDVHREAVRGADPPHRVHVARATAPEPVIVAEHQLAQPDLRLQHLMHERVRREARQAPA